VIEQGTDEWRQLRCGKLGASQVHMAIARTKSGWSASRENIMAQIIVERMTGIPTESFTSSAMEWGTLTEPQARAAYSFARDVEVQLASFVPHPRIAGTGASPDGLVGERGLLEIKAPNTATHIETLLSGVIDGRYMTQMRWQMACTGREWVDFVSFDPRLPGLELWVKRVDRQENEISLLEEMVEEFLFDLESKMAKLNAMRQ